HACRFWPTRRSSDLLTFWRLSRRQALCLSLHDALPIFQAVSLGSGVAVFAAVTPHSAPPLRLALAGLAALATRPARARRSGGARSEEHTSELQSLAYLVCRLLLEKKKKRTRLNAIHRVI